MYGLRQIIEIMRSSKGRALTNNEIVEAVKEWMTQIRENMGEAEFGPYSCERCEAAQDKLDEIIEELDEDLGREKAERIGRRQR